MIDIKMAYRRYTDKRTQLGSNPWNVDTRGQCAWWKVFSREELPDVHHVVTDGLSSVDQVQGLKVTEGCVCVCVHCCGKAAFLNLPGEQREGDEPVESPYSRDEITLPYCDGEIFYQMQNTHFNDLPGVQHVRFSVRG